MAIARARFQWFSTPPRDELDEPDPEQHARLVQADVAIARGGRLRKLAQHHQLGQRRHAAGPPNVVSIANRIDQVGRELKDQTFVAVGVLASLGSTWLVPLRVEAYLGLALGLLVVGLGLWMLWMQRELPRHVSSDMKRMGAAGRGALATLPQEPLSVAATATT